MAETHDTPRAAPPALGEEMSNLLKKFGFDPGVPVYDFTRIAFGVDRLKEALFDSTFEHPITLPFLEADADPASPIGVNLAMVVETAQAYYAPHEPCLDGIPIGCWENPEFYLRGFAYKSGFDPYPEVVRMHVYLRVHDKGQLEGATLQFVRKPSGADPATPLVYGNSRPGHINQ
jgi:hypothetical protein